MPARVIQEASGNWLVPQYGDYVRVSSLKGAKSLMKRWGYEDVEYVPYEPPATARVAKEKVSTLDLQVIAEDLLSDHAFDDEGACDGCGREASLDDSRLCESCYGDGLYNGLVMEAAHEGRLVRRSA